MTPPPTGLGAAPSRRVATAWNVLLAYGGLAVALTRNLALVPVYLHYIPAEEYGAWLATGTALANLLISEFGLMGVVIQRTATAYGRGDVDGLGRMIGTSLWVAAGLTASVSLLVAAASPLLPPLLGLGGATADRLAICFAIVAVANGLYLFALACAGILRSLQRPRLPGTTFLVADLLSIGLTLLLLVEGHGLYALAYGVLFRGVVSLVSNGGTCLWVCWRQLGLRLERSPEQLRALWRDSYYQFFSAMAMRFQLYADPFLVGLLLGPESVTLYVLTVRAHDTVRSLCSIFGGGMTPSLAHLHGTGQSGRFRQVVLTAVAIQAVLGGVGMAGVAAFNADFVRLWVGDALFAGMAVTVLYALFGIVDTVGATAYDTLVATGGFRRLCRVMWIVLAARLPLTLLLLQFGLWGAPLAALIGVLLRGVLMGRSVARLLELDRTALRRLGLRVAGIVLPAFGIGLAALAWLAPATGWTGLLVRGAGFVLLVGGLIAAMNREMTRDLLGEMRSTLYGGRRA